MSKAPRRWVTVENTRSLSDSGEKRKPSVFERLGSAPGRSSTSTTPQCKKWATTGACNYGNTCRFRHGPRRSDREKSPPDLRQKVVRKRDKGSESESEGEKRPDSYMYKKKDDKRKKTKVESIKKKKDKESKVKSTIVVQPSKYKDNSDESDSEDVDNQDDSEMDETMRLERKRQQLQRELSRLEAEDDSDRPAALDKPSSSLDETSDTGPSTPPHKGSHSRDKYEQIKKQKHSAVPDEPPRKKSVERKKTPKLAKKKSHHTEDSSEEESYFKEKPKKKAVLEKVEKPKRDRSVEDMVSKTAAKSKKKQPQVEKRSRTRTMSTTSTSSTSSSSTSPSSSSQTSSSEDEEYRRPRKKSTKSPDQRRRKSSEHKRHVEGKQIVADKVKKDKQRNKPAKSPVKTKKGYSPSASYDERQRRESPDDRSRSSKKSLSPSEGRKGAQGKGKRSLSPPREGKKKSGVSPAPRTRSPGRTHSPDRGRRERSLGTGGRGRKGGEDTRRRQSPSDKRSASRYEAPSDGTRASRRPPSPEERHQRDTRRADSPENSRRDTQRSLDRQSGRRNVTQDNYQKRLPSPEQRGRQGRDNRDARDSRGVERRAVTPDGSSDRSRRDQSLVKGRRGASQEDDSRERPSPISKSKFRQEDSGRRQMTQEGSDRHRPISPAPIRDRGRSPQRGQERNEGMRDKSRRLVSPEQDRGKNRQGISADRQRKERSPPAREDPKGRRGRSPQRQQVFDRNRGQQEYRDNRDNRDNVVDDNIQNRILSMAGYQSERRGNDRRGDRMGREMDYRKNTQDDGYDRNVRDRDQSKGRQPQFHEDYQDQGGRDRRDRSRYDEMHDQRRGRDQQWDDRRGDERFGNDRRGDDRRSDGIRYGRDLDNRGRDGSDRRSDLRKRPLDDDRGRSPPNKQQRREGSPADSHLSASSRGKRDEWDVKQQGRSRDRGENEFERKGRDAHDNRDGSQKRGRSPSDDRRQPKRQKAQYEDKKVSSSTEDRQRKPDSQSEKRGSTAEEFSDWSENDTDAELLSQPNEDKYNKNVGETEGIDKDGGRNRGRERESNKEERDRRSQSRTSIGSRQSYREDRAYDRKPTKGEQSERGGNRGGRNRDQRWKSDDREGRAIISDRKDIRRDKDRKQSDSEEKEIEQISETEKEGDRIKKKTSSDSSSQHSTAEAERESTAHHAGDDGNQRQDTEASSEAETDKKKLDMEYDEISDDDLDELIENADADEDQEQSKAGIVDSLDIDWASLCSLSKPKSAPATTSALKRFTGANVFARIGLSKAYAGDALFKKIQDQCRMQQTEDSESADRLDEPRKMKNQPKFEFLNDVAMLHGNALQKLKMRMSILSSIGSHRRALCARKDLNIRRHLCKVSKNTEGLTMYPNPAVDQDLYKQSIQLLRQDRNSVDDKKTAVNPAVAQVSA